MAFQSNIVRYSDTGGSVSELQKKLNENGYNLDVDGVFGKKTQAAVKDYQTNNGLDVDGVVGEQTWGSLTGSSSGKPKTDNKAANTGFSYKDFTYDDYAESDTVTQALAALNTQLGAKPGEYQSTWQDQVNSIIDQILNRKDFFYDLNSDALYQQYKDQYTALGKLAMQDTMGQAAAMTGGYGNSYASTAGNQAYQSYLSQLNEVVPELYGMALDKYNQEGQELYNQYGILADQENQEYSRYQDTYNKWLTETDYLRGVYNDERSFDYGKYTDERDFAYGTYADDKSYAYDEYRNAIADEQWQKQFNLSEEQWEWEKEQYEKESEGTTGNTSVGTAIPITPEQEKLYNTSYDNGSLTNAQVKALQAALGVNADGKYGSNSKKAAGGLSAEEAYKKYVSGGTGDTGNTTTTSGVSDTIKQKVANFTTKKGQADYLAKLVNSGEITTDESMALLEEYGISELTDRSWEMVNDGGINWFGLGIDRDAKVKDEFGNEYTLVGLRKELEKTMSFSEAQEWVKDLQKQLGI